MNSGFKLTKKDALFLALIIVFAAVNLGAMGRGGRRRAKEIICLSNLRKWGVAISNYTKDNNGYIMPRDSLNKWTEMLLPYYKDRKMLLCPEAVKPFVDGGMPPFAAWTWEDWGSDIIVTSSYGINLSIGSSSNPKCWGTFQVVGGNKIPMLSDSHWKDFEPYPDDEPPPYETATWTPNADEMRRVCLNRHNGGANSVFMDLSARKVGLKELWELHWRRNWEEDSAAAGVPVWPYWMLNFKDFR